ARLARAAGGDAARSNQFRCAPSSRVDDARLARAGCRAARLGARALNAGLSNRNRELLYLIVVGLLTAAGFASVYIADKARISGGSLAYAGFFFALFLAAHVVARYAVPHADPYVLPIAALLAAGGVSAIYRPGPSAASR